MKLEYKFTILSFISLSLIILFLYIYWWGFLFAEGNSYYINLNNHGEFIFEFIIVHIIFIIVVILFMSSVKKVAKEGFRKW
ncbi:MAG: hypothetical protein ACFFDF_01025 [Candidatus Odinarchaeota archaeon]